MRFLAPPATDKHITYLSSTRSGPAEEDGSQISACTLHRLVEEHPRGGNRRPTHLHFIVEIVAVPTTVLPEVALRPPRDEPRGSTSVAEVAQVYPLGARAFLAFVIDGEECRGCSRLYPEIGGPISENERTTAGRSRRI